VLLFQSDLFHSEADLVLVTERSLAHRIDFSSGDQFGLLLQNLQPKKIQRLLVLEQMPVFVSFWIVQMHQVLSLRTEDSLKSEC